MKKGLATIAAGSFALTLSALAANANGRECDRLSPCTPNQSQGQNQGQGQHQGQHQGQGQNQGQNQTATGVGIGIGQGGNANSNANSNSNSNANSNSNSNSASNSNSNAVTSTQVRNTIRSTTINPATPGTIYGQVNGQCMATKGVSIGAYLGSISLQNSEFNMDCMAWNSAMVLLDRGINLHDPMMQAVAIETFREMDRRIDDAVISVLMAQQARILNGQGMANSAWELIELDGKHGQPQRHAPRTLSFD